MKKILVTRSSMPSIEEYIDEIQELWDSHWLTNMGEKHRQLEVELKKYLGVNRISLFINGHMALELAIQAMNLSGEVITTPFTFASTTHAIVRNGLTPVFCDINPEDFTMDVNQLERLITDKTSAIIPVHVYGNVCNVEEIRRIAKRYGLKVIYDAAHTFGVKYKDKGIGLYGDASMFSFHATKVYNSIEGGAVIFHEDEFGQRLQRLKNFGIRSEEVIDSVGVNAKMNEFQAAMGLCNLRHVSAEIEKRQKVYEKYVELLSGIDGIQLLTKQDNVKPNYAYFPVVFHEKDFGVSRNEVYEALKAEEIYARKYFYPLTSAFDCFQGKYDVEDTPIALYISKRILTLPLYADLKMEDVERICNIIVKLKK
ncbi:MAG: DegT/DnrJ/EryC1/StrS family aminotransferase [Coprococcus phoceensis]